MAWSRKVQSSVGCSLGQLLCTSVGLVDACFAAEFVHSCVTPSQA
jgi:hypothetical protein